MVLVDQAALRKRAASECSRQLSRLERAKAEWKRFETEDKVQFDRWMAATFGATLSRIRELGAMVAAKEALVNEVQEEMFWSGARNERTAYAKVQERRDNPPPEPEPERWEEADDAEAKDNFRALDEEFFKEFLRMTGVNPKRLSKADYDRMFAEFSGNAYAEPERGPSAHKPAPQRSDDARLKELYRQLVRRLHPDTRTKGDADVSALWHEVQDAYNTGNVERLETLLGLTDFQANATGEHTSVSQMRAILTELRRSFNGLQRNLRIAKNSMAWNFSQLKDRTILERRTSRELAVEVRNVEERLRGLEALIASWAASPKAKKTRATREFRQQPEFLF